MRKLLLSILAALVISPAVFGQTNGWIGGYVKDSSNIPVPGITVFFYGTSEERAQGGPNEYRNWTFTDSNGYYEFSLNGFGIQQFDTVFVGVLDCNRIHYWDGDIFDSIGWDTLSANFRIDCIPEACDFFLFDSIAPSTFGPYLSMQAIPLRDSIYTGRPGSPVFEWIFSDSIVKNGMWIDYGVFDTTQPLSVCLQPYSGCTNINCKTILTGSIPTPPAPNVFCNAGWVLDTVNSIIFNGNLIVWDISTAVDSLQSAVPIVSWFWDFGDGNYSSQQYPTHTYADTGWQNLCLTITAVNGTDTCTSTFCDSLGIDGNGNILYKGGSSSGFTLQVIDPGTVSLKETTAMEFKLYPNPATSDINLSWNNKANTIELYNLNGALIKKREVKGLYHTSFNVNDLPAGVYVISISGETTTEQIRFVKH